MTQKGFTGFVMVLLLVMLSSALSPDTLSDNQRVLDGLSESGLTSPVQPAAFTKVPGLKYESQRVNLAAEQGVTDNAENSLALKAKSITSLTVTGALSRWDPQSSVSIIAIDDKGREYTVFSTDVLSPKDRVYYFTDFCMETCVLPSVTIRELKVSVNKAMVQVTGVDVAQAGKKGKESSAQQTERAISQQEYMQEKESIVSQIPEQEVIEFFRQTTQTRIDWTNHHFFNWVSPHIESQEPFGTCWAFASTAALESMYRIAHFDPTKYIDLAELQLLSQCTSCWTGPAGCRPDGGNPYIAMNHYFQDYSMSYETSDCWPYSDLLGTPLQCSYPPDDSAYSCSNSLPPTDDYETEDTGSLTYDQFVDRLFIKLQASPVVGVSVTPNSQHSYLIYGYDKLLDVVYIKDSAGGAGFTTLSYVTPERLVRPVYFDHYKSSGDCQNLDGDAYCYWGSDGFLTNNGKPSSCDDLYPWESCSAPVPDFEDADDELWGVEHTCGNGVCEYWETCYTNQDCYYDCWWYAKNGQDGACCGNGILEAGEDCTSCPQDLPEGTVCPECNDRWDNNYDGAIDFPADPDCESYTDNNEGPVMCGDYYREADEMCELNQNPTVVCFETLSQANRCYGTFNSGDPDNPYEYWDKGVLRGRSLTRCYPLFGSAQGDCQDCSRYVYERSDCKVCTAVEFVPDDSYSERVYVTDEICRYLDDEGHWIDAPWEELDTDPSGIKDPDISVFPDDLIVI